VPQETPKLTSARRTPPTVYLREDPIREAVNGRIGRAVRHSTVSITPRQRARGAWGKTSVYEVLKTPKDTGYQVFNRRASRSRHGKVNDPVIADVARRQNSILRQAQDGDPDDPFTKALSGTYNDLEAEKPPRWPPSHNSTHHDHYTRTACSRRYSSCRCCTCTGLHGTQTTTPQVSALNGSTMRYPASARTP